MKIAVISGFPLSPSVNEYLMPVAGQWATNKRGQKYMKGRWVKTKKHSDYMTQCRVWASQNRQAIAQIIKRMQTLIESHEKAQRKFGFELECVFFFANSRVWSKETKRKKIDDDNRIKPVRDALSHILGLDDKYFNRTVSEICTVESKKQEHARIQITLLEGMKHE